MFVEVYDIVQRSVAGVEWVEGKWCSVRVWDPTSAQAGGYRSLLRCIAPLLPDPGKCWQRPGCTGRMIPKPRDLTKGQVDVPMM